MHATTHHQISIRDPRGDRGKVGPNLTADSSGKREWNSPCKVRMSLSPVVMLFTNTACKEEKHKMKQGQT